MIAYLTWLAISTVGTFLFLPFYVSAQKARDLGIIPRAVYPLVIGLLLIGGVFDVALNVLSSLILLDAPFQRAGGHREITFSQRLKRLQFDDGWRGDVSRWIAATFILWIDPDHLS